MPFLSPDSIPPNLKVRRLFIPDESYIVAAVSGALTELIHAKNWEQFGAVAPDDIAQAMQEMLYLYFEDDMQIGMISPYITQSPPLGCLPCDGSTYQRSDYPRLYAVINPALVINADEFTTPDLRGQFIRAASASVLPLSTGGENAVTLTEAEMPSHSHTSPPHAHSEITAVSTVINGGLEAPASAATPFAGTTGAASALIDPTGGGQPHNNIPEFVALNYYVVAL